MASRTALVYEEFGNEVGTPKLLDLFEKNSIKTTQGILAKEHRLVIRLLFLNNWYR